MRFVDTSFWFAAQDGIDRHHAEARLLVERGLGRIVSTNHVVGETWTLMGRRLGHSGAVGFLDRLNRIAGLEIVHIEPQVETEAWAWLRRHDERDYSFVDATSFAVMRRRRIREALAFDADFGAAGFVEVRAG